MNFFKRHYQALAITFSLAAVFLIALSMNSNDAEFWDAQVTGAYGRHCRQQPDVNEYGEKVAAQFWQQVAKGCYGMISDGFMAPGLDGFVYAKDLRDHVNSLPMPKVPRIRCMNAIVTDCTLLLIYEIQMCSGLWCPMSQTYVSEPSQIGCYAECGCHFLGEVGAAGNGDMPVEPQQGDLPWVEAWLLVSQSPIAWPGPF